MNSNEILHQFLKEALTGNASIAELEKILQNVITKNELIEAAKARYVIGFIRRALSYQIGDVSAQDLCLNLRDIALIFGRLRLPQKMYDIVKTYGKDFDLTCEVNNTVSSVLSTPKWMNPRSYISEVYALIPTIDELESQSVGDGLLSGKTVFNAYKSFEQKIAVHTAIMLPKGYSLLISQPTGGGKSLVTQMLAACSDGLTLVIVPTVALTLDQYNAANSNLTNNEGIFCYHGDLSDAEKDKIIVALKEKTAKILFSSPEAIIKNNVLYTQLGDAAVTGYLNNIIIDEAHIVPDWGVFFRPDFQVLSVALKKWRKDSRNSFRTFMLSATLSDDVVDNLFFLFGEEGKNIQVRCDSLRQEPRFYFYSAKSKTEQTNKTLEAIRTLPKPLIVYVLEPREAEDLQKQLKEYGYLNIPTFTGNTADSNRNRILKAWKNNEYDIILATSAFGLGVDKPDVRTIVHACVPENLSRFYQEVGRAGRDKLPSLSIFIPYQSKQGTEGDVRRALGLVNKRVLTVDTMVARWVGMTTSVIMEGDVCTIDTSATPPTMTVDEAEFAGNLNISWNVNLLFFLYRTGFIDLNSILYQTNRYLITIKLLKPRILNNPELLNTELQNFREIELNMQLNGYRIMRDLVQRPLSECWGHIFKQLFPLAKELCNGCPADLNGKSNSDVRYKLRVDPELRMEPTASSRKLDRKMGIYRNLLIIRKSEFLDVPELQRTISKAQTWGIGALVLPASISQAIDFEGLILTYEEFYFIAEHAPYLLFKGVFCAFSNDQDTNYALWKTLEELTDLGYHRLLFCSDHMTIPNTGKPIIESIEGYHLTSEEL